MPQIKQYNIESPVIVIGAGRSGSTLLSAILNAHPSISFFGETYFLAPFMWQRVFEQYGLVMSYLAEWRNPEKKERERFESDERHRVGKLIAQFMADLIKTDPLASYWGFKEIWNGSPQFETFDWKIFDSIFPCARYIHLVRNPFRYAISTAGRDDEDFSRERLIYQLSNWVKIHEYNSKRGETERYHLVRYEDIVARPDEAINRVCGFIGIDWRDECLDATRKRWVPSLRDPLEDQNVISKPIKVEGLYALSQELGYLNDINSMGVTLKDDRKKLFFWK